MDEAMCAVIPNICEYRLEIEVSPGSPPLSAAERSRIEQHWLEKRRENPALFNGITYSVERLNCSGRALRVEMSTSDYAHYLYTIDNIRIDVPCCMVAVGALLMTRDGFYVTERMADHTNFPGIVQCVGGGIDAQDASAPGANRIDPARTLAREVFEETGLKLRFYGAEPVPKYFVVRKDRSLLGVCYVVALDGALDEVLAAFDRFKGVSGPKCELSELVAIRRDRGAIEGFLASYPNRVDYLKQVLLNESEAALDNLNCESAMDPPSR